MWDKIKDVLTGQNKPVHDTKNKYTSDMLRIHAQAKAQVRNSEKTVTMIENSTAYRIAKSTGRLI
jgi:hypothetical protein